MGFGLWTSVVVQLVLDFRKESPTTESVEERSNGDSNRTKKNSKPPITKIERKQTLYNRDFFFQTL
jgi:hypothetical protein